MAALEAAEAALEAAEATLGRRQEQQEKEEEENHSHDHEGGGEPAALSESGQVIGRVGGAGPSVPGLRAGGRHAEPGRV